MMASSSAYSSPPPPVASSSPDEAMESSILDVPSADVLRLIQSHLIEAGLHASASALRSESGEIGLPGLLPSSKATLVRAAQEGRWGEALQLLDGMDVERVRKSHLEDRARAIGEGDGDEDGADNTNKSTVVTPLEKAVALAHETTILELAAADEAALAYAALRICASMLDRSLAVDDDGETDGIDNNRGSDLGRISSRSGDVERRITALASLRRSSSTSTGADNTALLPPNYYGVTHSSAQKRRDHVAKLLRKHVPEVPPKRLASLLGQSLKWQCHTGTFPAVQRLLQTDDEDGGGEEREDELHDGKKKKKKKRRSKPVDKKFDLVLGNVDVESTDGRKKKKKDGHGVGAERIPSRPCQSVRLGKKSYIESACFLPDGGGLITGSSDGFIEIWGEPMSKSEAGEEGSKDVNPTINGDIDYEKLSDLPYQRRDDLLSHDAPVLAMDVSPDGTMLGTASSDGMVCVWKVADGKLLRKVERAHGGAGGASDKGAAVTCIQFSPDGSKVLTGGHDSTAREYGLIGSRMLKEFRGHRSYVNCCSYVVLPRSAAGTGGGVGSFLAVVTASADGSVRVWDGKTAEPIREIAPPIPTSATAVVEDKESIVGSKSVHTVVHLHSPPNTMIVVPRCDRAYLMSYSGAVLRTYARDDVQGGDFLAAAVSPSNRWLYVAADDGKCVVFDIDTGRVEKIIRSFADECSSGKGEKPSEVSGIVCHPHRGLVGGFSNDKGQKRGVLTLWK